MDEDCVVLQQSVSAAIAGCQCSTTYSGINLAMTLVAEEGAKPSPSPTCMHTGHDWSLAYILQAGQMLRAGTHQRTQLTQLRFSSNCTR